MDMDYTCCSAYTYSLTVLKGYFQAHATLNLKSVAKSALKIYLFHGRGY